MITNFRGSKLVISKQDVINGSGWFYSFSVSSSSPRRDTISLKMKKLIDLAYLSCLSIVKNNIGNPGCACYETLNDWYVIQKFDVDKLKYYVFRIGRDTLLAEINDHPLRIIDVPRKLISVDTFDRVKDIIGNTFNELEKLGKEWQVTTII